MMHVYIPLSLIISFYLSETMQSKKLLFKTYTNVYVCICAYAYSQRTVQKSRIFKYDFCKLVVQHILF